MPAAETAAARTAARLRPSEVEPLPRHSILLLGAGSGTGRELAKKLAREGYHVIAGSRSQDKIDSLAAEIAEDNGVVPTPFIADITDPNAVRAAYESLQLAQGESVHYFPVAAGGLEGVMKHLTSKFLAVIKAGRRGELTPEMLATVTEEIRAITMTPGAMEYARRVNVQAPLELFGLLQQNGHITRDSVVLTTSSSISHNARPHDTDAYPGPFFYYTVAHSKQEGVEKLRTSVTEAGARFVDFVAPEIEDTAVGGMIGKLSTAISTVNGVDLPDIPTVTIDQVASGITAELMYPSGPDAHTLSRTVYVTNSGIQHTQPDSWQTPMLPYL